MKKTISRIILFLPVLALVCACAGFQNNRLGTLSLKLRLEADPSSGKALDPQGGLGYINPAEDWEPVRFAVSGAGPGGATFSQENGQRSFEAKLVPGEWTITARAFSSGNKEVASGTASCFLQPGRTTSASVTLYPLEGTGDLEVALAKNLELPPGGRIVGSLVYKGLPGRPAPASPTVFQVDIPAEQTSLSFQGIPAGYYALALSLKASDGVVSGGAVATVMIMAGFLSAGGCTINMGMPVADISASVYPSDPLPPPFLSVGHSYSPFHGFAPLAVSRCGVPSSESVKRTWYVNGEPAGEASRLVGDSGLLPEGTYAFPQSSLLLPLSYSRIDLVEESAESFRSGSASVALGVSPASEALDGGIRGTYDYMAALSPSLQGFASTYDRGKGSPYEVRAAAASPSGLIVVSGMDELGAIHAFAAGYGAGLDPVPPSGAATLSIDASWMRLWRDKIKVGSSFRAADRLAVSDDGRFVAAASSASDWLWLCALGADGSWLGSYSLTSASGGDLADLDSVKALCFSADSNRLYAATVSGGTVFAFDVGGSGMSLASHVHLSLTAEGGIPSPADLKVTESGTIVVSADGPSRLYLLSDDAILHESEFLQGASNGPEPYHPTALAVSAEGDAFYALCNEDRIVCLSRLDPYLPYLPVSAFSLPAEAEGALWIAAGKSLGGINETILVVGGEAAEFFEIDAGRAIVASRPISPSSGDPAGIGEANGLCFARGAFILSGGDSGLVSVLGSD